ncbi:MAG: DUF3868 domain-containing protein [Bacteroidales bacterium]|nr:DUF3868 domain-containing protein [Bacteroidales bacterium]
MGIKKICTYIALTILFPLSGQVRPLEVQNFIIGSVNTESRNDSVYINMIMDIEKVYVKSHEALLLTPVIQSGQQNLELPAVFIGGKNKYKAYRRALAFGVSPVAPVILKAGKKGSPVFNYEFSALSQDWMESANLKLKEEIYGCAECRKDTTWSIIAENIFPPHLQPLIVTYVTPPVEEVKSRNLQGKAYLDFQAGKSVILPDFRNNPTELEKINTALSGIKENRYATITSIDLTGYASPEGPSELNERLSRDRSLALKTYLQNRFGYASNLFNVSWKGEDWEGLGKLMETSDIKDRYLVLDIVHSSVSESIKDQKIKTLSGGSVYKTLLNEYYPLLRRVEYKLNYTIRAFSISEGMEILKTAPGEMSLNEMFLVANTYPKGSKEFNDVFDIAVRVYPLDTIANINAGAMMLEKNDTEQAHHFLDKYENEPAAWNNLGILYLKEDNFDKAEQFFNKAILQNQEDAIHNLEQLKILRKRK